MSATESGLKLSFPVFGVKNYRELGYAQPRVDTWNRLWTPSGPLWNIAITYESVEPSHFMTVVSDGRLSASEQGAGHGVGPTGKLDAFRLALLTSAARAGLLDDGQPRALAKVYLDGPPSARQSATDHVAVSGVGAEMPMAVIESVQVGAIDLPHVAVGFAIVRESVELLPEVVALAPMNDVGAECELPDDFVLLPS